MPASTPTATQITRRFEAQTRMDFAKVATQVLEAANVCHDTRLGIVAEPTADWLAAAWQKSRKLDLHAIAVCAAEQAESQHRAHELDCFNRVTWQVLKLPKQPNPAGFKLGALLCGAATTTLMLNEFFAWAREAVVPGGYLVAVVELYSGFPTWQTNFTKYRQWRARYVERLIDFSDQVFPTRDELIETLQTNGFSQILIRGLHKPGPLVGGEYVLVTAR